MAIGEIMTATKEQKYIEELKAEIKMLDDAIHEIKEDSIRISSESYDKGHKQGYSVGYSDAKMEAVK